MSDVKGFKLISGQEIIGQPEVQEDGNVIVKKAAVVVLVRGDSGQSQIQMQPPSILAKGQGPSDIVLERAAILYQFEIEDEYERGYLGQCSGIFLPPR